LTFRKKLNNYLGYFGINLEDEMVFVACADADPAHGVLLPALQFRHRAPGQAIDIRAGRAILSIRDDDALCCIHGPWIMDVPRCISWEIKIN
jgi:hypothetical protein